MNHQTLKDMMYALYDGELDARSRKIAEAHLAECAQCRQDYQRWVKTAKTVFPAVKPELSEFFVQSVMNRIHELEKPRQVFGRGWRLPLGWLAPAVGATFIFLLVMPLPLPDMIQNATMESFLFQGANQRVSWMFSGGTMTPDETLQLVMEGQV